MRGGQICACGERSWGVLTRGYVCIADASAVGLFEKWDWHAHLSCGNVYARRSFRQRSSSTTQCKTLRFHEVICPPDGSLVVDHRDGIGLHNWSSNLRRITGILNSQIRPKRAGATSKFKGVCFRKGRWIATIMRQKKQTYLGAFQSEIDAAKAYDAAALTTFGIGAALNFPEVQS